MKFGLDDRKIRLLEDTYKDKVLDTLKENCFLPYYEIYGFGYKSALKLADGFQIDKMIIEGWMPIFMKQLDSLQ